MKKFILSAATAAAALTTLSADQFYVIMKDGSVESYPTEKVDSISFNDPQIAKIMGFNEMAAELIKLKERVAALEAKSGVVDTSSSALPVSSDLKYFVLNDKEVEVAGIINGSENLVIPASALVNGKMYTVTSIGQEAFKNQSRIKTATLPNTIKSIEDLAFYDCRSLTSINIPSGVTSIGDQAFVACENLTSIDIPSSVTSIGYAAFQSCSSLTKLTVPSSVTTIGNSAFYGSFDLDLVIDNSRSNVECEGALYGVKSVTFTGSPLLFSVLEDGSGVEVINSQKKEGGSDNIYPLLKSIKIPSEVEINGKKYPVTSIGQYTFNGCENLESIEIPSSVKTIKNAAFGNCSSLTSIEIPLGVTSIESSAFMGCKGLRSITIPSSVTYIGSSAFSYCNELDVTIDNSRSNVECEGALHGVKSVTFTGSPLLFSVLEDGKSVEVVNTYGDGDDIYPLLKSIKIPSEVEIKGKKYSVTSIGRYAFNGCDKLESIEIPSSVTSIGIDAFFGCDSLTSIEIPSSVTSIGIDAFYGCENLDVVIDNSRYNVECMYAFQGVKSVKFTGSELNFRVDKETGSAVLVGSFLYNDSYGYSGIEKLTIPSEVEIKGKKYPVTSIEGNLFRYDSTLVSIEIPSSVTLIGNSAFSGCSSLTSIEIPSSVTSIGEGAFGGCSSLTSIEIPSSVTSIGDGAFGGCSSLTSIEIPSSVTFIGNWAFSGCGNLDVVIDNSEGNVEFDSAAFEGCKSVTFKGKTNSSADVDSNAQIQVTLGGSYKATNEQLGEFSFYVQSVSGTYAALNRVIVLKDYATGNIIELSDAGAGYLMLDDGQVVAVKNATARSSAKYLIAGLQYGDVENDYTIISASENSTMKSLGATKTTFVRTK